MNNYTSITSLTTKLEHMTSKITDAIFNRNSFLVNYLEIENIENDRTLDTKQRKIIKDTYINIDFETIKDIPIYTFYRNNENKTWHYIQPIIDYTQESKYTIFTSSDLDLKPNSYLLKFMKVKTNTWDDNKDNNTISAVIWLLKITQCLGTFGKTELMQRKYTAVLGDITNAFPERLINLILEREYQRHKVEF